MNFDNLHKQITTTSIKTDISNIEIFCVSWNQSPSSQLQPWAPLICFLSLYVLCNIFISQASNWTQSQPLATSTMSSATHLKAMFSLLTTNRSVSVSANLNSSSRHRQIPPVKLGLTSVGLTSPDKPDKVEKPAGRAALMAWSTNGTHVCVWGGMHTHITESQYIFTRFIHLQCQ